MSLTTPIGNNPLPYDGALYDRSATASEIG